MAAPPHIFPELVVIPRSVPGLVSVGGAFDLGTIPMGTMVLGILPSRCRGVKIETSCTPGSFARPPLAIVRKSIRAT